MSRNMNYSHEMKSGQVRNTFGTTQRYDESIDAYNEAIKIDPKNAGAWNKKGKSLQALNRTTDANEAFAKAKELGYNG